MFYMMEHTIWNIQYGTYNMEHTIWNIQYGTYNYIVVHNKHFEMKNYVASQILEEQKKHVIFQHNNEKAIDYLFINGAYFIWWC